MTDRGGLFDKGRDRIHCRCSSCDFYFVILKKNFDANYPVECPNCGITDGHFDPVKGAPYSAILVYNSTVAIQRWHEGYFNKNRHFESEGNPFAYSKIPHFIFDFVLPHCSRFDTLVLFVMFRFIQSDGWLFVSQKSIARHLGQDRPDGGQHIPARQNVAASLKELWHIRIIFKVGHDDVMAVWLLDELWIDRRRRKIRINTKFPEGAKILRVEKQARAS